MCIQIFDLMTARETLWFYGRIRGIEPSVLKERVETLINQVGLTHFADRTSGTYSGGNKRKLSLAVSLIGSPRVLLLDEPSSGMDPFARRQMWDVIAAVSEDRSVVLTTHSMEECEALCTRIGIMVDGSFRCLGSSQQLKDRYGSGYQIEIRMSNGDRYSDCIELCKRISPECSVEEKHGSFLRLKVPNLDLGYAFSLLENHKIDSKEALGHIAAVASGSGSGGDLDDATVTSTPSRSITVTPPRTNHTLSILTEGSENSRFIMDYTISQNTLEQVFIKFARLQEAQVGLVANLNGIVDDQRDV